MIMPFLTYAVKVVIVWAEIPREWGVVGFAAVAPLS